MKSIKLSIRNISFFLFYTFLLIHIVFRIYYHIFPNIKIEKMSSLINISCEIQKNYPDVIIQLEPYAIDCGVGRCKISYIIENKSSEIQFREGKIKEYSYYIINCKNVTYINIEQDTYINNMYPFLDFYLYTNFGKSFGNYLKIIGFYFICSLMVFVTYKPYISYNKK